MPARRFPSFGAAVGGLPRAGGTVGRRRFPPARVRGFMAAGRNAGPVRMAGEAKRGGTDPGVRLLSGGNPQIAKGEGAAPVAAWLAAAPGWKGEVARAVDRRVVALVPGVRKAVKYNSPLYGRAGAEDWFLSLHCFETFLRLTFFNGAALVPPPPGPSRMERVRYLDLRDGASDDAALEAWIGQAAALPGERI